MLGLNKNFNYLSRSSLFGSKSRLQNLNLSGMPAVKATDKKLFETATLQRLSHLPLEIITPQRTETSDQGAKSSNLV